MNHLKCTLLVFSAALLTACGKNENIVGKWMQTVPGLPELKQGFVLEADGKASSVNMATLSYKAWQQEGAFLILSGKSVDNHQVLPFSDTLHIEKLTQDSLILKKGELILRYAKEDTISQKKLNENIPASLIAPAKKTLSVKGKLIIGAEVRSFIPEGSDEAYWVIDKTGKLYQQYDKITKGVKNGIPVYAELQVEDMGKSNEGFAANYKSVYHIHKINKLHK